MNLIDELTQKQANKFQLHRVDPIFINQTISNNNEGIFNLDFNIVKENRKSILNYLNMSYKNFEFELNYNITNYEIMFKRKGEIKCQK